MPETGGYINGLCAGFYSPGSVGMAQAVVIGIMLLQGTHIGKPADGGAVLAGCYKFPADTARRRWVGDGQDLYSALDFVDGVSDPTAKAGGL